MLHHIKKNFRKKVRNTLVVLIVAFFFLGVFSYLTNPFTRYSLVKNPFEVTFEDGEFTLEKQYEIHVNRNVFHRKLTWMKKGYYILSQGYRGNRTIDEEAEDDIIKEIYKRRFDTTGPYLIAGDHFNMFYPRNLGIFYYPLLDEKTAFSESDWKDRQEVLLKTTAFALEVFTKAEDLYTTVVPISRQAVSTVSVFAYPSDTLYSLLYAIESMRKDEFVPHTHFIETSDTYELYTEDAATQLLATYKDDLKQLIKTYQSTVYDPETGLIKEDIHLSGTKDIAKRQGAFYDNVVYWRTMQLAMELDLIPEDTAFLGEYKTRILETYWYEEGGYFLEDLSPDAQEYKFYSSDWLIVLYTGFLDITDSDEREYFTRSVAFIQQENIDEPFGLRYHNENRRDKLYFFTRVFVPSYGGSAIWSNWGMDYAKTLTMLYRETGEEQYLTEAEKQLASYQQNITDYKGFPEVYHSNGIMLRNLIYESMRTTGWVVNYVQAREMLKLVKEKEDFSTIQDEST